MRTVQAIGPPRAETAVPDADAVVVALKSRTLPPAKAVRDSRAALAWLRQGGARQVFFKYCSTFDSTPRGNIGPVADALLDDLGDPGDPGGGLTIACPAFPTNGRTVYKGHLFVGDVLLENSGMRNHPLTPMRESDLVAVLAAQTPHKVGLVEHATVRRGAGAIRRALSTLRAAGVRHAIVDAIADKDLAAIGRASADLPLLTGGSGVAMGLPANFREQGLLAAAGEAAALPAASGHAAVLAGSCAPATLGQIERMAASCPSFFVDSEALAQRRRDNRALPRAHRAGPGRCRRRPPGGGRRGDRRRGGGRARRPGAAHRGRDRPRRALDHEHRRATPASRAEIRQFRRARLLHARLRRPPMTEAALRERIVRHGASLFARGYGCGASGNVSVLLDDGLLVTPTDSCLGRLDPERIARLGPDGSHLSGDAPSKEAFLHVAMYRARPDARAIVHLHSTCSEAVSCLADVDPADVLPPLTAYYVMRVGRLPLIPYHRPGDRALAAAVEGAARTHHALLLANHGPVVAAKALDAAVYAAEELEETAKLHLLLRGAPVRLLTGDQVAALKEAFPT